VVFAGCGRGPRQPSAQAKAQAAIVVRALSAVEDAKKAAEAQDPARSHLLGTIERRAIGPFAASGVDGGIAAWIVSSAESSSADLVVVPFGPDAAPLRSPRVVATVPREATSLVVRRAGRDGPGWLVAWSALLDRGEALTLLGLAPDGSARGAPVDVQRTNDHVAWADLFPAADGALCLWAEETTDGGANILAAHVDSEGKPPSVPVRVMRGVRRWSAAAAEDGAGLALVTRDEKSPTETLSWQRLGFDGAPRSRSVIIARPSTVSGDVEVAAYEGGWLLGWTDRSGDDPEVTLAGIDVAGRVQGPSHALDTAGGSTLVALASGPQGAALAWDEPYARARPSHALHLAKISTGGGIAAHPVTSFSIAAQAPTQLVSTARGFALLTTPVATCSKEARSSGACPPSVPTFLSYDEHLSLTQAEPFLVGEAHVPATLGWALRCAGDRCEALAATAQAPTPVFGVDLKPRQSPFATPAPPLVPPEAPRATGVVTLASGHPFADVAAARLGATTMVATMTNAVDVPTDRSGSAGATITVRPFDDDGRPLEAAATVTSRAIAVGRLAVATTQGPDEDGTAAAEPARGRSGGVAVAWVKRDDGDPQVHLAHLDARGHRTKEVQLTTARGDASDVALAWANDGWVVGWVDWRDGNGEVYVAKVDRDLNRVAPDQRVTHAPGDAADVVLAVGPSQTGQQVVWLAWSDPRESPGEGLGDVYVTTLRPSDAKPSGEEVRVLATAAHSGSPELAAIGGGAVVAWIEAGALGLDAPGGAMFAWLDAQGKVVGGFDRIGNAGRPTAIALAASRGYVQAVVARAANDVVTLDALRCGAGPAEGVVREAFPLVDLNAPAPFDVALALAGGALFYNDTGAAARDHRVRRMAISWQPAGAREATSPDAGR
jgi:hypothetical protein